MQNNLVKFGAVSLLALVTACQGAEAPTTQEAPTVKPMPAKEIVRNPTKDAYFGDLHVHTKNSFDAFIVGTRSTADDAYRFAKGETIPYGDKDTIKLSGDPLDFYGVTDHGEYMGVIAAMRDRKNPISKTKTAKSIYGLTAGSMQNRREAFIEIGTTIVTGEEIDDIYDREFIDSAWASNVAAAEKHNDPGTFTTFAAYEFTAMEILGEIIDNAGAINLHRNVVFEDEAPKRLFSTLDSTNPEDLWEWMNSERAAGRDVLAIPHNSNASNGRMFDMAMIEGGDFTKDYAENRLLNEPIVEITQVKGTSETHPSLSPNDEFANHELYEILVGMPVPALKVPGSFVRPALSRGIAFDAELGANPYQFGLIGSSDSHVSGPSLSEKEFFGKFATDRDMQVRGSIPPNGEKTWTKDFVDQSELISAPQYGASGLAGVWAEANTRKDLFASMRAKETFATSGPRIRVRMFAGADYNPLMLAKPDMVAQAYAGGTPMGGEITSGDTSPDFLAWATMDPNGTPLQRLQIVKVTSGSEAIYDVACANGGKIDPVTHRCSDNGARVDLSTCTTNGNTGTAELKAIWQDPDYEAGQSSTYYVRALENPKCRWSTWDAIRNGTPPNPSMQATLQDRAWGSPIWVKP